MIFADTDALLVIYFVVSFLLIFTHQYRASLVASFLFIAVGTVIVCRENMEKRRIQIVTR